MRPGQHNKRPRGGRQNSGGGGNGGGGGGGRKPGNGPNRTYDSNGPDVKVRGTASTVFEKYQQLARDAQSAGDRVAAENYLQHAEHYYRLMLANNLIAPRNPPGMGANGQPGNPGNGPQPEMPPFDLSLANGGGNDDEGEAPDCDMDSDRVNG
jgi:hypothetical protein